MVKTENGIITITCDKCGDTEEALPTDQKKFYLHGWILNTRAKKYKNRCWDCLTKSEQKARTFVINKFG